MYLNAVGDIVYRQADLGDSIPQANPVTAAGWLRILSDIDAGTAIWERYGNIDGTIWQGIYIDPTGTAVLVNNSGGSASGSTEIGVDNWVHVAYVRDGTNHYIILNGVLVGTSTGTPGADVSTSFALGGNGDIELAHWRIWEAALTADELLAERQSISPVRTAGLWANYEMANGALAADSSGNGRDLRLNGTVVDGAEEPGIPQVARPSSDVSDGAWTPSSGVDLYGVLDEVVLSDADYITTNTTADACVVALGALSDPTSSAGHLLRYRLLGDGTSGITVELLQGSTTIATWTHDPAPATWTTYSQTLTGTQADSITDYTALRLRFTEV